MHTKNRPNPHSRWSPVLGIIEFLIYYSISEYIFSNIFGTIKGLLCTILLIFVVETVKEKWRSFFKGTVYGNVILKSGSIPSTPLKNVEISWGPSHHLKKQDTPVRTNAKGEFRFENLPLSPTLTLTAKLTNNRYIHHAIGDFEGVRWFLGKRWLGFPISPSIPKRIDFVLPSMPSSAAGNP